MKALVLGGKGDIGNAIVQALGKSVPNVLAVGRSDFDLAKPEQIDRYFEETIPNFDIVVHSGGLNHPKPFDELTEVEIKESLEANVLGFLHVIRRCLPHWKEKRFGRVVVISSLYGFLGRNGRLPYVMSKHALNGAVKTLAIELAGMGVLVNSVSPGYIETKLTRKNNNEDTIRRFESAIPVGRLGAPEDIAKVVFFLCSSDNQYLTGQDIVVDGGYSVGGFQG